MDRVDLLTGTLGKALGVPPADTWRSRKVIGLAASAVAPVLFSNSIPPVVAATTWRCSN